MHIYLIKKSYSRFNGTYRPIHLDEICQKWTDIQVTIGNSAVTTPQQQTQSLEHTCRICYLVGNVNMSQKSSVALTSIRYSQRRSEGRNILERWAIVDTLVLYIPCLSISHTH